MNPVTLLRSSRSLARQKLDPCVDRCVLGTRNHLGEVEQRVLVLRDIEDELAVFYSASSAKHRELLESEFTASLLVFLPTIGMQFRITANLAQIDSALVAESWQMKPNAAKRMDALYRKFPQSTVIGDLDEFEIAFAASVPPTQSPRHGVGYFIRPKKVECLELRTDPNMHVRTLYELVNGEWRSKRLVP